MEDSTSQSDIPLFEEMLKFVLHMRMTTAKMRQAAVQSYQPDVILKVELFKSAQDSADLKAAVKKVEEVDILTFEEIKEKVEHFL